MPVCELWYVYLHKHVCLHARYHVRVCARARLYVNATNAKQVINKQSTEQDSELTASFPRWNTNSLSYGYIYLLLL